MKKRFKDLWKEYLNANDHYLDKKDPEKKKKAYIDKVNELLNYVEDLEWDVQHPLDIETTVKLLAYFNSDAAVSDVSAVKEAAKKFVNTHLDTRPLFTHLAEFRKVHKESDFCPVDDLNELQHYALGFLTPPIPCPASKDPVSCAPKNNSVEYVVTKGDRAYYLCIKEGQPEKYGFSFSKMGLPCRA